jgi:hypothetical protein
LFNSSRVKREVNTKRRIIPIAFLFLLILSINTCQEQNSIEPVLSKVLYKLTHTHIGPCVYCYTDSIGNPVVSAFVYIYQDSILVADLGQTDSTGWIHNEQDLMDEGWYTAKAETRKLYSEEGFYYDLDTLTHIYLEMYKR